MLDLYSKVKKDNNFFNCRKFFNVSSFFDQPLKNKTSSKFPNFNPPRMIIQLRKTLHAFVYFTVYISQ